MPLSLAKIATNTAAVTFTYEGESVTINYYPGRITEHLYAQLQSFDTTDDSQFLPNMHAFNQTLATLIKSWDVYEDEEQQVMFPLDATRLAELPFWFRSEVIQAIMRDVRPEALASQ